MSLSKLEGLMWNTKNNAGVHIIITNTEGPLATIIYGTWRTLRPISVPSGDYGILYSRPSGRDGIFCVMIPFLICLSPGGAAAGLHLLP